MSIYTYKKISDIAESCYVNTKKKYKNGIDSKWSYYICKAILTPKKDVTRIGVKDAPNPYKDGHISRTVKKDDYLKLIKDYVQFVEKNKRLPNYVKVDNIKVRLKLWTAFVSYILYKYNKNKKLPSYQNINSKIYINPSESQNEVYKYFVKVFGNFGDTIDGALSKIQDRGYGYYYDDVYSNKQSIDRMKKGQGVNCTDSCHVFYNILLELIRKGKYKKVECIHVHCSGGDGHVRLRITLNDGDKIYRDPACALSDNGSYTCNWCMNGEVLAVDPNWFIENLNR